MHMSARPFDSTILGDAAGALDFIARGAGGRNSTGISIAIFDRTMMAAGVRSTAHFIR
jgi:hypothetical protein